MDAIRNATYTADGTVVIDGSDALTHVFNNGDIAFLVISSALVLLMTPGVGFMYSGLLRRTNALSQLLLSVCVLCLVTVQWVAFGYSLAFGRGSSFIGDFSRAGLFGPMDIPSPGSSKIPEIVFALFHLQFASMTAAVAVGATAERGRIAPTLIFALLWTTLVYDVIAHWNWHPSGWAYRLGAYDFAGGTVVHQSSGAAALAYSIWLGKRRGYGTERLAYRPNNIAHIVLGTALLWFGWTGFNAGSELAANLRSAQAAVCTNVAAAAGGVTWMMMDWRYDRRFSAVSCCSGILTGLIAVTPAAGYVASMSAMAIGVVGAVCANCATRLKFLLQYDDALDIFSTHGVGGLVGSIMTGILADKNVILYDGTVSPGGWINRHWMQVPYQLADCAAVLGWSFCMTTLILLALDRIPGLSLRVSDASEDDGIDEDQLGEIVYSLLVAPPPEPPRAPIKRHVTNDSEYPDELSSLPGPIMVALRDERRPSRMKDHERIELSS